MIKFYVIDYIIRSVIEKDIKCFVMVRFVFSVWLTLFVKQIFFSICNTYFAINSLMFVTFKFVLNMLFSYQ